MKSLAMASLLVLCLFALAACETASPPPDDNGQDDLQVLAVPAYLSFDGTSIATVDITANGRWTAETDQEWLIVSPAAGTGSTKVTVAVNRDGLVPSHYAGSILFRGAEPEEVVTVSMRFPTVKGEVGDTRGQVSPANLAVAVAGVEPAYVPGQVLVLLHQGMATVLDTNLPGLQPQAAGARLSALASMAAGLARDYSVEASSPSSSIFPLVVIETNAGVEETVAALQRDGRVAHAQPNYLVERPMPAGHGKVIDPSAIGVTPAWAAQWHYHNINLGAAWAVSQGSEDVTVAVIDSGFAVGHPDLAPSLLPGYDFGAEDRDVNVTNAACLDHGTHVAGTVAAAYNVESGTSGVAPGVRILPLEVGQSQVADCPISTLGVTRAIAYAAGLEDAVAGSLPEAVDVMNISLGAPASTYLQAEVVAAAISQGVTVVAAAGNDDGGPVNFPAALPGVIGVAATDYFDNVTYYSNVGQEIDIAAPGGDTSTDHNGDEYGDGVLSLTWDFASSKPTYTFYAGTSMASPHVAGVAALMKTVNRDLTPFEVQGLLASTALPLGDPLSYGAGLVDAGDAVQAAQDALSATYPELVVRLSQSGVTRHESRLANNGTFEFPNIAAGSYEVEAGTDVDGDGRLGEPGEFYATTTLSVEYSGDTEARLTVYPQ